MADIKNGAAKNAVLYLKHDNVRNRLNIATNVESVDGMTTSIQNGIVDAVTNSTEVKDAINDYIENSVESLSVDRINNNDIDALF